MVLSGLKTEFVSINASSFDSSHSEARNWNDCHYHNPETSKKWYLSNTAFISWFLIKYRFLNKTRFLDIPQYKYVMDTFSENWIGLHFGLCWINWNADVSITDTDSVEVSLHKRCRQHWRLNICWLTLTNTSRLVWIVTEAKHPLFCIPQSWFDIWGPGKEGSWKTK